ncbi:cytokinin riboside 5'-monophosphate phosphoribohydrolase [Citrus sinensis]|nr:cytokinin riboside 5'-monophosphate phosphoribohydrolase [Citrus sinensis]
MKDLRTRSSNFEVKGYFLDKDCIIVDPSGNIVAQIGVKKEIKDLMESKDLYHIVVKPGIDQAFIVGVIATLDYIYGESTRMTATTSWIPLVICFERDGAFDLA